MAEVKNILEGWANVLKDTFGTLPEDTRSMARERLGKCDKCPIRVSRVCSPFKTRRHVYKNETVAGCGCILLAKVTVPDEHCPAGEW